MLLLIIYGSLYPWHFDFSRGHVNPLWILLHAWPRQWNRFIWRDVAVNVVFYAPFGAAAFLAMARRWKAWRAGLAAVALSAGLSASMEMLQIYVPGRDCSLLDLASNTAGGAAGALAVWLYRAQWERRWRMAPRRWNAGVLILLVCWVGYQWYPFFPALSRTRVHAGLAFLLHGGPVQPVELWAAAAGWFTVAVLWNAWVGALGWGWLPVALGACWARLLVHGRALTGDEVLGAALGLALWVVVKDAWRPGVALGLMGGAILLRELAPFRFSDFPAPFRWIPFAGSLNAERQAALLVFLRKAFDYGSMVWLLGLRGVNYRVSGAALAAALLICEWLQRYLPRRTPEMTDAVLAALMAGVLALAARRDIGGS